MDLKSTLHFLSSHPDYSLLTSWPDFKIDIKYASTDNFMKKDVYGIFNKPFLHKIAAQKLIAAQNFITEQNQSLHILIYDALRPRCIQRVLWEIVEGTTEEAYVANPDKGSIHNYGMAIDLTLSDAAGNPLDMGTPFDYFDPLSQPQLEEKFLKEGKLTSEHIQNRLLLRNSMVKAGFLTIPHEWWHFNALDPNTVRANYQIIE